MCGIIYSYHKKKGRVGKIVTKRFEAQKGRGSQGFGFVGINHGRIVDYFRSETEHEVRKSLKESNSEEILFHHRLPTSTPNITEANHPIKVSNDILEFDYYVVHNGVLSNESALKPKHEAMGFDYNTEIETKEETIANGRVLKSKSTYKFNDSEAFAIEFALFVEGKKDKIEASGTIAFFAIQATKTGEVISEYYGRNEGNPLCVEENKEFLSIKSQGGKEIEPNVLFKIDAKTRETYRSDCKIGNYYGYKSKDWNKSKNNYDRVDPDDIFNGDYKRSSMGFTGILPHRASLDTRSMYDEDQEKLTTIQLNEDYDNYPQMDKDGNILSPFKALGSGVNSDFTLKGNNTEDMVNDYIDQLNDKIDELDEEIAEHQAELDYVNTQLKAFDHIEFTLDNEQEYFELTDNKAELTNLIAHLEADKMKLYEEVDMC